MTRVIALARKDHNNDVNMMQNSIVIVQVNHEETKSYSTSQVQSCK